VAICATKKKSSDKMQNSGWYGFPLDWSASLRRAHENKEQQKKDMNQKKPKPRQREQQIP
jgi:hypothetical protein